MNKNIQIKKKWEIFSRIIIFSFSSLAIVSLIIMSSFILKASIPAYKEYGFFNIYFTNDFSVEGNFGIWSALLITMISSIGSVFIALPLSLRVAIFIRFRVNIGKRYLKTIISILAGIPSVVFGIFAWNSLSNFSSLLGSKGPNTLINSILMLTIMLFPILTSLIYNQLKMVDINLLHSSIALGNTKTYSIYKVIKKSIRPGIYVAIITGLGRAIGETMALSMILTAPSSPLQGTFNDIINAPYANLGVEISRKMFMDGSKPTTRSALFAAGIALFILIMILVGIVTRISNKKNIKLKNPFFHDAFSKNRFVYFFQMILHSFFLPFKIIFFIISYWLMMINKVWQKFLYYLILPYWIIIYPKRKKQETINQYFSKVCQKKTSHINDYFNFFWEILASIIIFGSSLWIFFDVMIYGLQEWSLQDWKFAYRNSHGKMVAGTIMNPLVWTIVLFLTTIIISFPFALCTALFLSEYANHKKSGKIVRFFLDSLGGTPSILFGIFGVIFFLDTMNLRREIGSTSLIAGSLTMVLVILPIFTRTIEQVLIIIPNKLRYASYALGNSKFETIRKVIIPQALPGIASGIILSISRIISETAPIYLTLGMFSGTKIGLLEPGHTITTDILNNQIFSSKLNINDALKQSYKLASVALIIVTISNLLLNLFDKKTKKLKRIKN